MKNKRVYIAALTLCAVLLLVIGSFILVRHECSALLRKTDAVEQALAEETPDETVYTAIGELESRWESGCDRLQLVLPWELLTDLNDAVSRLRAMYDTDCDELRAELAAIRTELEWIRRQEVTLFLQKPEILWNTANKFW